MNKEIPTPDLIFSAGLARMIDSEKYVWAFEASLDSPQPVLYKYTFNKDMCRFFKEQAVLKLDGTLSHYGARHAIRDWNSEVVRKGFYSKRPVIPPKRKPLDLITAFKTLHEGGTLLIEDSKEGLVRIYLTDDRLFSMQKLDGPNLGWVGYDMTAFMNATFYEDK